MQSSITKRYNILYSFEQLQNSSLSVLDNIVITINAAFTSKNEQCSNKLGMDYSNFTNVITWLDEVHILLTNDLGILILSMVKKFPEYYYFYSWKDCILNKIKQNNKNGFFGVDAIKIDYTDLIAKKVQSAFIAVINILKMSQKRERETDKLLHFILINFKNIYSIKKTLTLQEIIRRVYITKLQSLGKARWQ